MRGGRGAEIRTRGLKYPKLARYQTALRPGPRLEIAYLASEFKCYVHIICVFLYGAGQKLIAISHIYALP